MVLQLSTSIFAHQEQPPLSDKIYICTASDARYFPWMIQMIGSVHKVNFNELAEIAVYDLGFTQDQKNYLNRIEKVRVYDVEMIHKDLLSMFLTNPQGKRVRGWYAWKPVIIKQALERFPFVLYLDAGCVVMRPLNDIFRYIQEKGYFLIRDQSWFVGGESRLFKIKEQCTSSVVEKFQLRSPERSWILDEPGIVSGAQGLSRKMLDSYVKPTYDLAKELHLFADDGTAPLGFGWARHDQTIYSVYARLLKLDLVLPCKDTELTAGGKSFTVHTCDFDGHNPHIFYNCKGQVKTMEHLRLKRN